MTEVVNQNKDPNRVMIFDTTLRDGNQSLAKPMTTNEKIKIARQLATLGVDVIEAGFPGSNPEDFRCVQSIAKLVGRPAIESDHTPIIAGLARAVDKDIDATYEAVREARFPRIHTFIATSPEHRTIKFRGKSRDEVKHLAVKAVTRARSLVDDVEFSLEDAGRTEADYMVEVVAAVIDAGATTVNIPDTVGYCMPDEYAQKISLIFRELADKIREHHAIISTHCHDDLGMAVANSILGVKAGARQIECTMMGLGERAGNASLEQVVMSLKTRQGLLGFTTNINTSLLVPTAQMVSEISGVEIPEYFPIVGGNAFKHRSGIHQNGVIKGAETYEIMTTASVGWQYSGLEITNQSGADGIIACIKEAGITQIDELSDDWKEKIIAAFKEETSKDFVDYPMIISTVAGVLGVNPEPFKLQTWSVEDGLHGKAKANVSIERNGEVVSKKADGAGQIAASVRAIQFAVESILGTGKYVLDIDQYKVVHKGDSAAGKGIISMICRNGHAVPVRRSGIDIVQTTVRGYMAAVNAVEVLPNVNAAISELVAKNRAA